MNHEKITKLKKRNIFQMSNKVSSVNVKAVSNLKQFKITVKGKEYKVKALTEKQAYYCVYNKVISGGKGEPGIYV
jgi:hypothetical protein